MSSSFCDLADYSSVCAVLLHWARWVVYQVEREKPLLAIASTYWNTADPLAVSVAVALALGALCFLLSLPTRNYSWVDKMWSLAPPLYLWRYALHDRLSSTGWGREPLPLSPRLLAMAGLGTAWSLRLTYNFARKGGYRWSGEDYRWPYIRARVITNPLAFFLFNATFVALVQHLLLAALASPAYLAWQNTQVPLNALDAAAFGLSAFFILFEAVADQQQWTFQNAKHAKLAAGKRLTGEQAKGFITSGLFRYSRHPNFWAEQCLWWSMWLFGVAATGEWVNWTLAAPVSLTLLFQGSTWLTERISAEKYPKYTEYQSTISRFLPWWPATQPPKASGRGKKADGPAAATTPRSACKKAAATATPTPVAAEREEEVKVEEQQEAAPEPTPAAAKQRRGGRGRATKAAAAEVAEVAEPSAVARLARSPRKTARAAAAGSEEAPAPVRHSSRLRARAAAA